ARLGDRGSGVPDVPRARREARAPAASVGSPVMTLASLEKERKVRKVMTRARVTTLALAVAALAAGWPVPGAPYEVLAVGDGGTIKGKVLFQGDRKSVVEG